ncbi:MAG: hypothetical protein LBQ58_03005 [Synergistaceae bacterium]|nr:hypothetical protein [Synergistaceae bacterium]
MKNRSALISALICVMLFCGVARADVAFYADSSPSGTLGVVGINEGDFEITGRAALSAGDISHIASFAARDRLIVVEEGRTNDDLLRVCDPANLSSPPHETTISGLRGTRGVEYVDGFLYFIGYDAANVIKVDANDYSHAGEYSYPANSVASGFTARGVSLAALGEELYALFTEQEADGVNYAGSSLVRLDKNLNVIGTLSVADGAHLVLQSRGYLYVAALGKTSSSFASGSDSTLERISADANGMSSSVLFSAADLDLADSRIATVAFAPAGIVAIATQTATTDSPASVNIYTLNATLNPANAKKLPRTFKGDKTAIVYDPVTAKFWAANDGAYAGTDTLIAFKTSGSVTGVFSASTLGGSTHLITPVIKTTSDSSQGEDPQVILGGCSLGWGGLTLAGALLMICLRQNA